MPPKTDRFEMRWESDMLAAVDRWRKKMGGQSRADAIRTLIRIGLVAEDVSLSDIAGALDEPAPAKKRKPRG
jgi:metal-responsive CopG/Arc/MetJ family transcriptional regulator